MNGKIDVSKIGRMKNVTYEKEGVTFTVDWKDLTKQLLSGQICLVTPDETVLSVVRLSQFADI